MRSIDGGSHNFAGVDANLRSCAGALGAWCGRLPYGAAAAALLEAGGSSVCAFESAPAWRLDEVDAEHLSKFEAVERLGYGVEQVEACADGIWIGAAESAARAVRVAPGSEYVEAS